MIQSNELNGPSQVKARRSNGTRDHDTEKQLCNILHGLRSEVNLLREEVQRLREEPPSSDPLLTAQQVADELQISVRTLRTITGSGELPCLRIRGSVRYDRRMVEAYKSRCAREGRSQ